MDDYITLNAGDQPEVDAAMIAAVRMALAKTDIKNAQPSYEELPLIALPIPLSEAVEGSPKGEYFIRATQGHSLKLENVAHLTPVLDDEEGRRKAGSLVHGTRWELWETLSALSS